MGRLHRRLARPGDDRALPLAGSPNSQETLSQDPSAGRLHESAPGQVLHRETPVGTPENHWFFAQRRRLEVPPRFTLELTNGRLIGDYAAHITAAGTLDYQTSDYFGIRSWQEHPLFLRRRLPPLREVPGTVVSLATRGTSRNYYHALMDLVARWGVFEETHPGVTPDAVVVNTSQSYHRELIDLLGLDRFELIESTKHVSLCASTLLVPCLPNPETLAPPWVTQYLRERLPARELTGLPARLYVTRGSRPNTRRVVEDAALSRALAHRGFVTFDPGAHSVQEQIDRFAAAEIVVAPHGAGLTNLNFCKAGVRVLELFSPTYLNPGFWAITANVPGSRYRYLVAPSPRPPKPGHPMTGIQDDIHVSIDQVLKELDLLLDD